MPRIGIVNDKKTTVATAAKSFRYTRLADKRADNIIRGQMLNAIRSQASLARRRMQKITNTFSDENKPKWELKIGLTRGAPAGTPRQLRFPETSKSAASFSVFTFSKIVYWLNYGTEMRHKPMTRDYIPKTKPGSFEVFAGRGSESGGWSYTSWADNHGIMEREWTKIYWDEYEEEFVKAMTEALYRGMRKAGIEPK